MSERRQTSVWKRFGGLALASWMLVGPVAGTVLADQPQHASGRSPSRSSTPPKVHGAPEIDPMLAVGGAILLVGGVLVLTGRRRKATA